MLATTAVEAPTEAGAPPRQVDPIVAIPVQAAPRSKTVPTNLLRVGTHVVDGR